MADTNKLNKNIQNGPSIILVAPQLPENIGMTARAMANFGLIDLRIVNPKEIFPCSKSISAAAKATSIIEQAKIYNSIEDALQDLTFVYATTARARYSHKTIVAPHIAMQQTNNFIVNNKKVGIMFGRERVGLFNTELSLADELITFPVNPAFASLNLAQAVLLIGYEWMRATIYKTDEPIFKPRVMETAQKNSLFNLFVQLEKALDLRGYFRPIERKEIMINNLRDVLTRATFTEPEIRLLRGVITSLEKFKPKC